MSYEKEVKERMVKKVPEDLTGGKFRGKSYPHIYKKLEYNFIDGKYPIEKALKGELTKSKIKYHYAEHLNSSQTMCIAFFKKFFESQEYEYLLAEILMMMGINVSGTKFTDAVFEYIPDANEGTNFDFYLKTDNGKQITWEIKFSESEFGGITPNKKNPKKYVEKWEKIYTEMLFDCAYYSYPAVDCDNYECLSTGELTNNCCAHDKCTIHEFYEYYQIRRNILYAKNKGDYVLFLTPEENHSLDRGRRYIIDYGNIWAPENIRNIYWEDLLEATLKVVSYDPELFNYYTKFKAKYFE